jgi:flagellar biogenesis protein FliO
MSEAPSFAAQLGGTALALVVVLALAWFGLRALKRLQLRAGAAAGGEAIVVLRSVSLGARERVVALRYRDHEYLVGVSANTVSLLDRLPAAPPVRDPDNR